MKRAFLTFLFAALCTVSANAQTLKSLMYNTTNGEVAYNGTNPLTFTNDVKLSQDLLLSNNIFYFGTNARWALEDNAFYLPIAFENNSAAQTRTNLGLGATWLTNTNVTNFRTAIGLGVTNNPQFNYVYSAKTIVSEELFVQDNAGIFIDGDSSIHLGSAATKENFRTALDISWTGTNVNIARTNLGLGATNNVAFRNITSDGNIVISNQSTNNNGLLFIYRTNNEAFLGLANLIASNNTTISNETLFRVGVAEATNRSAQFGFRTVRTNNGGEGFAVFSVYGYNALMMIGPSDRSRTNFATNTNAAIEADIWTTSTTNRVATLRDTNSGAFTLHQELGFSTNNLNTNAPATNNTVALWLRVWIGTNSYRLPLYQ